MHCGDEASGLHFLFARYTLHTSIHPHPFFTLFSSLHFLKQQNELLLKEHRWSIYVCVFSNNKTNFKKNDDILFFLLRTWVALHVDKICTAKQENKHFSELHPCEAMAHASTETAMTLDRVRGHGELHLKAKNK